MSKWDQHVDYIRQYAGKKSAPQIARDIGTTTNNLHKICHRNGISLPRPEEYGSKLKDRIYELERQLAARA